MLSTGMIANMVAARYGNPDNVVKAPPPKVWAQTEKAKAMIDVFPMLHESEHTSALQEIVELTKAGATEAH